MKKALRFLFWAILFTVVRVSAQTPGHVYGLDNDSTGVFWFSKLNLGSGQFTHLQLMPFTWASVAASSCSDPDQQIYYYCTGITMYRIDPVTGTILSTTPLPFTSTSAELIQIQYNSCDSMIYGVVIDSPMTCYFARYDPVNGTIVNLFTLGNNMSYCAGCMSVIDPVNQLYIMHSCSWLQVFSTVTGQNLSNTYVVDLPSETFLHMSFDCKEGRLIGTSANVPAGVKYLAEVDLTTGVVSHITQNGWVNGLWKPMSGGNSIDNNTSIYYYSGMPNLIVGVDIVSGDTVYAQSTGGGSFLFLQYFSPCECDPVGVSFIFPSNLHVYPNPVTNFLIVESDFGSEQIFEITDASGRIVIRTTLNTTQNFISVETLSPGIYFWKNETDGSLGKFIRPDE